MLTNHTESMPLINIKTTNEKQEIDLIYLIVNNKIEIIYEHDALQLHCIL